MSAFPTKLELQPIGLKKAYAFIVDHHRHHKPPPGAMWALACTLAGSLVGVAVVGRPVARALDDGLTAEVVRLCTDGTPNACSFLLGHCRRSCYAHGFKTVITYTLDTEPGTSLRAAGWKVVAQVPGRSWSCPSRPRTDSHPVCDKQRWQAQS